MSAASPSCPPGVKPVIIGCQGHRLTADERAMIAGEQPLGLILFARNVDTPEQVAALVAEFRDAVGNPYAPVLIDQEGGRVRRLKPPLWHALPPAGAIGNLHRRDPAAGLTAARLVGRLIGADLIALGIDVDCAPVADVRFTGAHEVIGDRAYGTDPVKVAALAGAMAAGLGEAGVQPVVKHIPGHGRAAADSHAELPVVGASLDDLRAADFAPFVALNRLPWAMTAHVAYPAIDPDLPATLSPAVISQIIRGEIGFDGVLLSDDVCMDALDGDMPSRAVAALTAGCDAVLHCSGAAAETRAVLQAVAPVAVEARRRLDAAAAWSARRRQPRIDAAADRKALSGLIGD
ncbi:beta-N-acetylhexosaminidase [Tistrella bauzanensis]|uniref:beta-N-acetylhexosaminidase n=1 Tax=Tistrella arctica TaxID=3133430 RepID=A0ABU9YHE1_9PROT